VDELVVAAVVRLCPLPDEAVEGRGSGEVAPDVTEEVEVRDELRSAWKPPPLL